MADGITIGVTGPRGRFPWAWWATRWLLRRLDQVTPVRLTSDLGMLDSSIAGVIIGGGNDIDPAIYGGDTTLSPDIDPERDQYELAVLREADARQLPVMGICRGAQLLNVNAGGSLISDLRDHRRLTSNKGTLLPRKAVTVESDSILARWLGDTATRVNSLHHQAIKVTGKNLRICARDRDGIVQGVESTEGALRIGVQWHPEYLPQRRDQRRLFRNFVDACRQSG